MREIIENIIKKNFPEKRTQDNLPFENSPEIYGNQRIEAYKNGFNQALSQIPISLIADEVLKVVVETGEKYIKENKGLNPLPTIEESAVRGFLQLLSNLSPNKENE